MTVDCVACGRLWQPRSDRFTALQSCPLCRRAEVAPTIERLRSKGPCCLLSYVEGRLAGAVDSNDAEVLTMLRDSIDARLSALADALHSELDEMASNRG